MGYGNYIKDKAYKIRQGHIEMFNQLDFIKTKQKSNWTQRKTSKLKNLYSSSLSMLVLNMTSLFLCAIKNIVFENELHSVSEFSLSIGQIIIMKYCW